MLPTKLLPTNDQQARLYILHAEQRHLKSGTKRQRNPLTKKTSNNKYRLCLQFVRKLQSKLNENDWHGHKLHNTNQQNWPKLQGRAPRIPEYGPCCVGGRDAFKLGVRKLLCFGDHEPQQKQNDQYFLFSRWEPYMSNELNLLQPRKDVAEMVIVFCVSLIIPEGLVFVDMKWASDWKKRSRSIRTSSSRRTSSSSRRKSSSSSSNENEFE